MYLELISSEVVEHKVELLKEQDSIEKFVESDIRIVYQDQLYNFFIGDLEETDSISVIINNQIVPISQNYNENKKGYDILFRNAPFLLIYGITDIIISFEINGETRNYYSPYLAIATKEDYKESMNSIHEMLNNIYLKEHKLLQTQKGKNTFQRRFKNQCKNNLDCEIEFFNEIIIILKQYSLSFMNFPKTIPVNIEEVDNFEKVRQINNKTLKYIINNPNQLYNSKKCTGIEVNGNYYTPKKTLVNSVIESRNTIENQAIVSFINLLFYYATMQIKKLEEQLSSNFEDDFRKTVVKRGYIISFTIIEQYIKYSFKDYLKLLKVIVNKLKELIVLYKKNLIDTNKVMYCVPQPTLTFLEIHHYRIVYEYMVKWFSLTKPDIPNQIMVRHFHTADRIYEYYSLLNIIDILQELGFKEDEKRRLNYEYDVTGYSSFLSNCKYNTFFFEGNEGMQVTLYYQPIIYYLNSNKRNGISLFRTNYSRHYCYYTPDFIIKIKNGEKERYGILDAKWRNKKSLKNNSGGFKDCVYKYYVSVADESTLRPVDFMWLLQGKDDSNLTYYHHSASSKKIGSSFVSSLGIVPFSPRSGNCELLKILKLLVIN